MAKKALKKPDLPDGTRRAFFDHLHDLIAEHGDLSVAALSGQVTGYSPAAIYRALTSATMPARKLVSQLSYALGGIDAQTCALAAWTAGVKEERALKTRLDKAAGVSADSTNANSRGGRQNGVAPPMTIADPVARNRVDLTEREFEVLLAWFQSDSKAEASGRLYITVSTINTHLNRIRDKYAAAGRPASTKAALVVRALEDRLVTFDQF